MAHPAGELPLARPETLADQVYRAIRARIVAGQLAPGEFVREKDLESLGVSRTPIRDALARLASEGFLERLPHRGFRVPEESIAELLELYPVVASLEALAGRLALDRFGAGDVARLERANRELAAARERGDVAALIAANNRFHAVFAERSGNARLRGLLHDLRTQLARLERWYYSHAVRTAESVREHAEIIDAIRRGDRRRALEILERNMALTYRRLVEEATP